MSESLGPPGTRLPRRRGGPRSKEPREEGITLRLAPVRRIVNVGYRNLIVAARVVSIVSPQSAPMRRLRREAAERGKLLDTTEGRRTRSILITDSDHVILCALNPETIAARLTQEEAGGSDG